MYCMHRFNILEGVGEGIVSPNAADVRVVASWLAGTDVEAAMKTVKELEKQEEQVKRQLSAARKALARCLTDPLSFEGEENVHQTGCAECRNRVLGLQPGIIGPVSVSRNVRS